MERALPMAVATRIDFRVDRKSKSLIERAAALKGQSLSDFAKTALLSKARHVLKQHEQTVLSDRDRDIFLALMDSDAKPNAVLQKAVRTYVQTFGE
jgi:uncharacterized protein (DUF1778 family)